MVLAHSDTPTTGPWVAFENLFPSPLGSRAKQENFSFPTGTSRITTVSLPNDNDPIDLIVSTHSIFADSVWVGHCDRSQRKRMDPWRILGVEPPVSRGRRNDYLRIGRIQREANCIIMTQSFSIQEYCAKNAIEAAAANAAALNFPESTKQFWESLQLPTRHPFCNHDNLETYFSVDGIPPMGALEHRFEDESPWEKLVTIWFMVAPPLLAMAELWLRLVAGILGSLGCIYLTRALWLGRRHQQAGKQRTERTNNEFLEDPKDRRKLGGFCLLTVASSLVLMTDTYYVLNNGATPGALIFLIAVGLAIWTCFRYQLTTASVGLWLLVLLSIHLVWDTNTGKLHFGNREEQVNLSEGLYFDSSNDYIQSVVDNWPETHRTYSVATGATPWMPSGDSRTGLPFLINHLSAPDWHRLFVRTLEPDEEYVALDIAFPREGVQTSQPLYMILHGLNGGSAEEYIRDFARRRTEEGSTVAVMVARGLMDLPVRG